MEDEYNDETMFEFLENFGDIALNILQSRDIAELLIYCDKLELWLLSLYMEFAHLKEGD